MNIVENAITKLRRLQDEVQVGERAPQQLEVRQLELRRGYDRIDEDIETRLKIAASQAGG
jgi:hypothetical protein